MQWQRCLRRCHDRDQTVTATFTATAPPPPMSTLTSQNNGWARFGDRNQQPQRNILPGHMRRQLPNRHHRHLNGDTAPVWSTFAGWSGDCSWNRPCTSTLWTRIDR